MTTDIQIGNNIQYMTYSVSYHEMIKLWMENYHPLDTVVVIYDPINHVEYIKNIGRELPEQDIYESKVLAVQIADLEDAIWIIQNISHKEGPFAQVWSAGRCITDNIDK